MDNTHPSNKGVALNGTSVIVSLRIVNLMQ